MTRKGMSLHDYITDILIAVRLYKQPAEDREGNRETISSLALSSDVAVELLLGRWKMSIAPHVKPIKIKNIHDSQINFILLIYIRRHFQIKLNFHVSLQRVFQWQKIET